MKHSTTLRTSLEVALARTALAARQFARQQRAEQRRSEWARRLDPEAYACERDGDAWIAEGPAGQRFEFRLVERFTTGHYTVAVASHTGKQYEIHAHQPGAQCVCSCPAFERAEDCKHAIAFRACQQAARMGRQLPASEPEQVAA